MTQSIRSLAMLQLLLPLAAAGCDDDPPTTPTVDSALPLVESFIGTVSPATAVFYSFTLATEGQVSLTLLEITRDGAPASTILGLGIGSPLGIGCTGGVSVATGPGPTPQLRQRLEPGVYCAQVSDTGQLTEPVNFALNISRPR
jgi:hypothetical protein